MREMIRGKAAWLARAAFVICCLGLAASAQNGGKPNSVTLERGKTAVLNGKADDRNGVTWAFEAKKGETMTAHLVSPGDTAVFSVTEPDGPLDDALEVSDFTGPLPSTGTYLIAVWNKKGKGPAVDFTLELTVK
jgi:hypothetical protein